MPIVTETQAGVSITSTGSTYLIKDGTTVTGPHMAVEFKANANSLFNQGTILGESTSGIDI